MSYIRYRILKCINTCEVYNIGPFGVCEAMGTGEGCIQNEFYYAGKSNLGNYYICKDIDLIDAPTHMQSSFLGVFEAENFEEIEIVENIKDYFIRKNS